MKEEYSRKALWKSCCSLLGTSNSAGLVPSQTRGRDPVSPLKATSRTRGWHFSSCVYSHSHLTVGFHTLSGCGLIWITILGLPILSPVKELNMTCLIVRENVLRKIINFSPLVRNFNLQTFELETSQLLGVYLNS